MGWIGSGVSWWLQNGFRDFHFSIVLGAEYLSYVKSIENHARAFLTLDILPIGTVLGEHI